MTSDDGGVRDDELVDAARAGDHAAYTALYQRHAQLVFAGLTHLVGPIGEREDLLQQVFLELYRALPQFRGEASLRTFLYRIMANIAFEHLRRQRRRPLAYSDAALDELVDTEPSPEERARRRDEIVQVLKLLERVKPAKRIAFALVVLAGLSLEDAAASVDASVDAVKQRVLHARRELLAMLARIDRTERSKR